MAWTLSESLDYYRRQGAPGDQSALIALLSEVQEAHGGTIPKALLPEIAAFYGTREGVLLALIRRIPRLKLADTHILELCGGPNCGKSAALAAAAEAMCRKKSNVTLKFVPCMRLCAKGPNLKLDGKLYHQATESLLRQLMDSL